MAHSTRDARSGQARSASSVQAKNNMNIKPLFNNVLIKPVEAEEKTAGGIYLSDNAKEKPTMGIVMALGEGDITPHGIRHPMEVKVGDRVMYKKWGGNEVKVGNEEWTIVEEKDILAVIS